MYSSLPKILWLFVIYVSDILDRLKKRALVNILLKKKKNFLQRNFSLKKKKSCRVCWSITILSKIWYLVWILWWDYKDLSDFIASNCISLKVHTTCDFYNHYNHAILGPHVSWRNLEIWNLKLCSRKKKGEKSKSSFLYKYSI